MRRLWCFAMRELAVLLVAASACASHADPGATPSSAPDAESSILTPVVLDAAVPTKDAGRDGGASRFITQVISFDQGTCAGFQGDTRHMPDVVFGPPLGGGSIAGSEDVVSLGGGG